MFSCPLVSLPAEAREAVRLPLIAPFIGRRTPMDDTSDLSCARQRTERIALLNDAARQGRDRMARIVMTSGLLAELGGDTVAQSMIAQAQLMAALRHCTFAPDSPERDFASMDVDGIKVLMKIDLYDPGLVKIPLNGSFC
jgi:hypothetical protein